MIKITTTKENKAQEKEEKIRNETRIKKDNEEGGRGLSAQGSDRHQNESGRGRDRHQTESGRDHQTPCCTGGIGDEGDSCARVD